MTRWNHLLIPCLLMILACSAHVLAQSEATPQTTPPIFSDDFESCDFSTWSEIFPAAIPALGPDLWLRSDVGVSSDQGLVSAWADLCGPQKGRVATPNTLSREPRLIDNALNGLPVLRFEGAQSLILDTAVGGETFTVFVVGKSNEPGGNFGMILGPGGMSENSQLRWNGSESVLIVDNALPSTTSVIGDTSIYHTFSVRFDGMDLNFFRDGDFVSSDSFAISGSWIVNQIGAFFSDFFLDGDIAEILVYDRSLTDVEHAATSLYLVRKYNLP